MATRFWCGRDAPSECPLLKQGLHGPYCSLNSVHKGPRPTDGDGIFLRLMLINDPKGGPCYRILPASLKLVSRASMSCAAGEVVTPISLKLTICLVLLR